MTNGFAKLSSGRNEDVSFVFDITIVLSILITDGRERLL
jgi:hypothetical protein